MTCYSVYEYGMHSSGEKILLTSYEEAREWAERHLSDEDYEKEFGIIAEDESTEVINVSLKASDAAKLRRMAQKNSCSVSSLIASFIK